MTIQSTRNDHSVNSEAGDKLQRRRSRLVEFINTHGEASVEDLAGLVATSRETIRRDLAALDAAGLIRKFHGGGRIAGRETTGEGPFRERMLENVNAKRAIARRAALLFPEGASLFIDSGSTTIYFAEALASRSGLTVITNSAPIAMAVAREGRHQVFSLGGALREASSSCLGSMTIEQARAFTPDHVVLTIGGLTEAGISDHDADEAALARAMVAQAGQLTVLADHSKLGKAGLFPVAAMSRISRLVTDKEPHARLSSALKANGVELLIERP